MAIFGIDLKVYEKTQSEVLDKKDLSAETLASLEEINAGDLIFLKEFKEDDSQIRISKIGLVISVKERLELFKNINWLTDQETNFASTDFNKDAREKTIYKELDEKSSSLIYRSTTKRPDIFLQLKENFYKMLKEEAPLLCTFLLAAGLGITFFHAYDSQIIYFIDPKDYTEKSVHVLISIFMSTIIFFAIFIILDRVLDLISLILKKFKAKSPKIEKLASLPSSLLAFILTSLLTYIFILKSNFITGSAITVKDLSIGENIVSCKKLPELGDILQCLQISEKIKSLKKDDESRLKIIYYSSDKSIWKYIATIKGKTVTKFIIIPTNFLERTEDYLHE